MPEVNKIAGNIPQSTGQPLADTVRPGLERELGCDLSGVRVYTDVNAAAASQSQGAQAFSVGQDIFFAPGQYNPGSSGTQQLLSHELTHVVQQNAGGVTPPPGSQ